MTDSRRADGGSSGTMHARRSTGNPAVFVTKTGGFASRPHDRFAFCNRVNYWMERTRVCGTVQCVAKRRRPVRHRSICSARYFTMVSRSSARASTARGQEAATIITGNRPSSR